MKNLLAIVLTLCTLAAFAQHEDNSIERKGFVFGIGMGGGVVSMSDSYQEVAFEQAQGGISLPNLKLGWMVNERLAILATFPGMIYEYEGKDRSFEAIMPSVQYWFKDRWWVNGGFGLAMDFPAFYEVDDFKDEDWNFGCAVALSSGYELVQKRKFALDLQSKLHLGRVFLDHDAHRDGVAFTIGIGFNWY
ncbi:MAG: hypothetical protein D6730_19900 [Bacteroidetes bacterium]|nr:MAG: hypothetical protein D6730_19900 [Bacteroidota bacterium]